MKTKLTLLIVGLLLATLALQIGARAVATAAQENARLSAPDHYVDIAVLSPDQQTVLYTAWSDGDDQENLYSAPLDGSRPPLRLNQITQYGDFAYRPQFSPDGSQAFYLYYANGAGQAELYTAPVDGSAPPRRLNAPLPSGSYGVGLYSVSPDGSRVVYIGRQDSPDADELYSAPADGSAPPTKLNGPLTAGGNILDFLITPDGSRVVFRADYRFNDVFELGSVPIDGSAPPTRLSSALVGGGDVQQNYQITPDGSRVVYRADALVDDLFELASVPLDGSAPPVRLNAPLPAGGAVFDGFRISPDSSRVLFYGDLQSDGVDELAIAPVDGGAPSIILNQPLVPGGSVQRNFVFTPDSAHVLFVADANTDERHELFTVPVDGGVAPLSLSGQPAHGSVYPYVVISPDGARAAYRVTYEGGYTPTLFTVPLDGSAPPLQRSQPLDSGGGISFAANFSPDGVWLLYLAANAAGDAYELYMVRAGDAPGVERLRINGPLVEGGMVGILDEITVGIIVPEAQQGAQTLRILYQALQDDAGAAGLYVTTLSPPAVSFDAGPAPVLESAGDVTATVRLDSPALLPVTVEIAAAGGDATEGADYALPAPLLTLAPGETSATVAIDILDDEELEGDETVELALFNPQQATLGAPDLLTLTIRDDEEEDGGGGGEPVAYTVYGPFFTR